MDRSAGDLSQDADAVLQILWQYLQWADVRLRQEYGIDLDIEALHDQSIRELDKLGPRMASCY